MLLSNTNQCDEVKLRQNQIIKQDREDVEQHSVCKRTE